MNIGHPLTPEFINVALPRLPEEINQLVISTQKPKETVEQINEPSKVVELKIVVKEP